MRRTESDAPGCAPGDEFDPLTDDFVSKERRYAHFDLCLSESERTRFSFSLEELGTHDFWPLLGFTKSERRLKEDPVRGRYFASKDREIKFGSHRDAAILEWYGRYLSTRYESLLARSEFADCVLAYRTGVGDNIGQAAAFFDEIETQGNVTAIALDIKGFFDHIAHGPLLETLKLVLEADRLEKADFHTYNAMTAFSWVDIEALAERLDRKGPVKGRLCTSSEFRRLVREKKPSIIQKNKNAYGIPQGTPLSGLYANIAMLEFDRILNAYVQKRGGIYRRYSDDLAFLVPPDVDVRLLLRHVDRCLKRIGLWVNPDKTEISNFQRSGVGQVSDRPFQYLGFTFDGRLRLVRSSSLNRYYSKMRRGVRAKVRAAKEKGVPHDQIYLRELFRKYTHFGKSRNFPRYVYRASNVMNAPEMRNQISGHVKKLKSTLKYNIALIY